MIATHAVISSALLLILSLWTFVLQLLETRLLARTQQRLGPNRIGWNGVFQGWVDYVKSFNKREQRKIERDRE